MISRKNVVDSYVKSKKGFYENPENLKRLYKHPDDVYMEIFNKIESILINACTELGDSVLSEPYDPAVFAKDIIEALQKEYLKDYINIFN